MARGDEVTSTYVNVDAKVMKAFKGAIKKEGFRLKKGLESAMIEYTEKRDDKRGETINGN